MRPVYSKKGCFPCKHRKKKCSEKKPTCDSCARLRITCSYTDPGVVRVNRTVDLGVVGGTKEPLPPSPLSQVQRLRPITFRNGAEESVVHRAPPFLLGFWSVASNQETRDLKLFLQMILHQDLVRNAAVACLSGMLDSGNRYKDLYYSAYGRSLSSLRHLIGSMSVENTILASIVTALTFIGLRESTGPDPTGNLFLHWDALLTVLARTTIVDRRGQLRIPRTLYLWVLEGALYHLSRIGMFSERFLPSVHKWREASFYDRLLETNADPASRAQNSPLMNGQYRLSRLILDVMVLHRSQTPGSVSPARLQSLHEELQEYELSLLDQFQELSPRNRRALRSEYSISCNSLRICMHALQAPSREIGEVIDLAASENLAKLLGLPMIETNHFGLTWGMQILACALRSQHEFDDLYNYFQGFKLCLDPGHRRRAELLFDRLEKLRSQTEDEPHTRPDTHDPARFVPIGLSLLQRQGGILS